MSSKRMPLNPDEANDSNTTLELVRVQRDTLEAQDVATVNGQAGLGAIRSGRWVAWPTTDAVVVLNTDTGTQQSFAFATGRRDPLPVGFLGDLLLITYDTDGTGLQQIDLISGQQTTLVEPVATIFAENATLIGDAIIWYVRAPIPRPPTPVLEGTPVIIPIEATSFLGRIERVDVATGERTTLVDDLLAPEFAGFALDGDRLAWSSFSSDFTRLQVETADLETGERATPVSLLEEDRTFYEVFDISPAGALVQRTTEPNQPESFGDFLSATARVETLFIDWDGNARVLLDVQRTLLQVERAFTPPRLFGSLAVVRDAERQDFILYDVATGNEQRVRPFSE